MDFLNVTNVKCQRGYTVLETVVAMGIFSIVIFTSVNMFTHVSNATARIYINYELTANARIAMDFLTTHIGEAQAVELRTVNNTNTLDTLWLHRSLGTPDEHIATFRYVNEPDRNWLMFGGRQPGASFDTTQELARYISNIETIIDEERMLMHIQITTDTTIGNTNVELHEPIILNRIVDLRHKFIK